MSTDPADALTQARRSLGARLRQLRRSAGLTGQALADATGQHVTRVSRIENGGQPPTERNIRDWCVACHAQDQINDLIATVQSVETAYLEWARQSRAGMKRLGDLHSVATYRRTTTFRIHEPTVLPGIFQTETYLRQKLAFWYAFLDAPDDTEESLAMTAERTAAALTRRGTPADHSAQLRHLLSLMRLPFVSVGIIPADAQRHAIATGRLIAGMLDGR